MELVEAGVGIAEVAERFGVSRQAVYDWKARYEEDREAGLNERSRRPHTSPTRTSEAIEQRVLEERRRWGFGSKKILRRLQDSEPEVAWPPRSTIDAILKRAGAVRERKRERRVYAPAVAQRSYEAALAGDVMTADYKGQFRLRNGLYCYPLVMEDPVSRYLLACDAYAAILMESTWASMVRVFWENGMPNVLHADNGMPFGTSLQGPFSTISVRLMKYDIRPVFSRPGHPQDNGRLERLNRTLLHHTGIEPAHDHAGQQVLFDDFIHMYNHERPHEALGQDRPAQHHRPSRRPFPDRVPGHRVRASLRDQGRGQQGPHLLGRRADLLLGRLRQRTDRLRAHRLLDVARALRLVVIGRFGDAHKLLI